MRREVKIARRAAIQLNAAARWWEENRLAAPGAIVTDFKAAIELLVEQPSIGGLLIGGRVAGVRRLLLNRVGYLIYYRFDDATIEVLAFWHASRGSEPKL